MGLENPLHIILILVVVLLVFGAKRLPEMGRSLGSGMRGFKEAISGDEAPTGLVAAQLHTPEPEAPAAAAPTAVVVSQPAMAEPVGAGARPLT